MPIAPVIHAKRSSTLRSCDPDHTAASFTVDPSAVSEKPYGLRIGESFWGSWVTELDTSVGGTFKVTTPGGTAEQFVTIH